MLSVGIAQIDVLTGDRAGNQRRVREWMAEHCPDTRGMTTLIVLPEMWDVGYALSRKEELADDEGSEALAFLAGLARWYGVWFAGGSVLARTESGFVNRAQVVDANGNLVAWYDKVHLFPLMDEPLHLEGGNSRCLFDIEGTTAGCVICYDLRFCEFLRRYAVDGAKALFLSAQWPEKRIDHWVALLRARAIENMTYIVACNRVGTSGTRYGGNSMVIDPFGVVLYHGTGYK
ncbi:MAG: carbon-nitrogen family hydrolase, partial [Synergistaceae bacterium]|nr:carbon-nitrogen family hydrolase [Synergistaceae bacterium]